MTIREQLRAKIEARLAEIRAGQAVTIAFSGKNHVFATDIGARVYPWRVDDVPDEEIPCCGFADRESPVEVEGQEAGSQLNRMRVEITGLVSVDLDAEKPEDKATEALGDLLAAIGKDPEFDNLADAWAKLLSAEIEVHPEGRPVASASIEIEIEYLTTLWEV